MIPSLTPEGHLPPGRYRCSLEELQARFVAHADYASSKTRERLFKGLLDYLTRWEDVETLRSTPTPLLLCTWVAGSFASAALEPGDMDITPVIDSKIADGIRGLPGSGTIKKLTTHRDSLKRDFGLEVFPLAYTPVVNPFQATAERAVDQQVYLSDRGLLDDWWQRCRVNGEDVPSEASCPVRRGYLEVSR